ncbi:MAG: hypothetical protein IPM42_03205 [Saprospiraceae bacterium]|nr:hypothetical protein [Saprospiraceae bacterium]
MVINLKELFKSNSDFDEKVLMKLLIAIKENQTQDFDYLKFKQSYQSLQQIGMEASTAAKSAFLTASTMGLTKAKLMASANHYKSVLTKEKEAFANALKYQIATQIDGKKVEVQRLKEKIEENIRKIEQLNKENDIIQQKMTELEGNTELVNQKIVDTRDRFKSTFDSLYEEIEEDILLFDKFL